MYENLALVTKYILTFAVYLFILNIAKLIYQDIKTITAGEDAKTLFPHLKLLTPFVGKSGEAVTDILPLFKSTTTLGRASTCGITLADQHISSVHARIDADKTDYYIEDLKSANGTFVNGVEIKERTALKTGDRISLGNFNCLFSEGGR